MINIKQCYGKSYAKMPIYAFSLIYLSKLKFYANKRIIGTYLVQQQDKCIISFFHGLVEETLCLHQF